MDPTFIQARVIVQKAIADSSNSQHVDFCLNEAQREVARARKWPELMGRAFLETQASYGTGTVLVTDGDATVTLTGGTFPTDVVGMRFAIGTSAPWYPVRTRTDGTHIELGSPYRQDTDATASFLVYKSNYSFPDFVERIEEMWLHETNGVVPMHHAVTDQEVSAFMHYPSGTGTPMSWYMMERDSAGNRQVLFGPQTPDDVFRVEYTYRRKVVDNQFSGNLDDSRWAVIVSRAKAMAYEDEFYDRSVEEMRRYELLLTKEWNAGDDAETMSVQVGQDRVDYPHSVDFNNLISRGTVEDPQ